MPDKKNEFIIRFDGVNLSKEATQRIQKSIGDIVLKELGQRGSANADGDDDYCGIYLPHKWLGLVVRPVDIGRPIEVNFQDANLAAVGTISR